MRFAPLLALAAALSVLAAGAASAQTPAPGQKQRLRITIDKRSYLDPGTVVKPGSRPYLNYALPADYFYPTFSGSAAGPGPITGLRQPLPGPFELPGY